MQCCEKSGRGDPQSGQRGDTLRRKGQLSRDLKNESASHRKRGRERIQDGTEGAGWKGFGFPGPDRGLCRAWVRGMQHERMDLQEWVGSSGLGLRMAGADTQTTPGWKHFFPQLVALLAGALHCQPSGEMPVALPANPPRGSLAHSIPELLFDACGAERSTTITTWDFTRR